MTRKTISRKTKGVVAAAAGGALLVASGGTFAYWLDAARLEGSTITAGELGLTASMREAEYSINSGASWTTLPDGYLMTPGHQARFQVEVTATVKGTALTAALNLGPARTDADTIPSTVVNWERSTDGGTNWVDVRTADVGVPIDGDTVNNETYLLRVTINFPWGIDNNAGNSFGRITVDPSTGDPIADPYQWTLEDAQLVLTQTGPNAPTP